jgi:hypothetical protein
MSVHADHPGKKTRRYARDREKADQIVHSDDKPEFVTPSNLS